MTTKELTDIPTMPTVINGISETSFRCYHILEEVILMASRGDSRETIFDMITLLRSGTPNNS